MLEISAICILSEWLVCLPDKVEGVTCRNAVQKMLATSNSTALKCALGDVHISLTILEPIPTVDLGEGMVVLVVVLVDFRGDGKPLTSRTAIASKNRRQDRMFDKQSVVQRVEAQKNGTGNIYASGRVVLI